MFELSLNALGVDAEVPSQEQRDAGAPALVALQVVGGSALPLGDPQNPGRPMVFPSAAVNFSLNKKAALEFAELVKKKAEELPDEVVASGKIVTAHSMGDVAQTAAQQHRLTKT